jgi:hypothetical protein
MDQSRVTRSKTQKMYLLGTNKLEDLNWVFDVQGSTGKNYKINIQENKSTCTCIDFKLRKNTCKHIMFISTRVLKQNDIAVKMTKSLSESLENIVEKYKNVVESVSEQIHKEDTCVICYEDYQSTDKCDFCEICKNGFHCKCMEIWLKQQNNCPLCRSSWNVVSEVIDPMSKFKI